MKVPLKQHLTFLGSFSWDYIVNMKILLLRKQKKSAALMFRIINTDICPRGSREESSFVLTCLFAGQRGEKKRERDLFSYLFRVWIDVQTVVVPPVCCFALIPFFFLHGGTLIKYVAATTRTVCKPLNNSRVLKPSEWKLIFYPSNIKQFGKSIHTS